LFLLTLANASEVRSELITFEFSGTVTRVTVDGDYQIYDFPDVGDPFTGFYTFDSSIPDAENFPLGGLWYNPNQRLMVSIGGFGFEGHASAILIFANYYEAADHIPSIDLTSNPSLAQILDNNNFSLVVRKENLVADPNVLPLSPPSLAGADQASLTVSLDDRDDARPFSEVLIIATLESLTIVPEPASLLLTAMAFIFSLQVRLATQLRTTAE
jgi:hypothetical protein